MKRNKENFFFFISIYYKSTKKRAVEKLFKIQKQFNSPSLQRVRWKNFSFLFLLAQDAHKWGNSFYCLTIKKRIKLSPNVANKAQKINMARRQTRRILRRRARFGKKSEKKERRRRFTNQLIVCLLKLLFLP